MNKIKLLYVATGDFGVPILEELAKNNQFEIVGVITAPDKPQGRKQVLTPTKIKEQAQALEIAVYSPITKEELYALFTDLKPDIGLVVAYGMFFPQKVLQLPRYGCINIHGSLLPQYRGASPIHQALLNGDSETGTTWIVMEQKMDAGPIIETSHLKIDQNDNFCTLYKKLAHDAAVKTPSVLLHYIQTGQYTVQDDKKATFCSTIDKSDGLIDFATEKSTDILNKFRAYYEWPNVYFKTKTMNIKVTQCSTAEQFNYSNYKPGTFLNLNNKKLLVATADGALELIEVQPPSKKPMSGMSFLNGYKNELERIEVL